MKKLIAGLLILTIVLMVTACQSRAQNTPFYATPSVTYSDNSSGPPSAPTTGLESTSPAPPVIVTQVPPPEITLQIPAAASSKGGNYVQSPVTVASVPVIAPTPPSVSTSDAFERMIVRTGIIQIVVEDIQASIGNINGLTGSFNGYVVNSKTWQVGDATQGSISVRVPAESYFTVLEAVRAMAVKVKAENTAATDVTDQYVDLTSQLTNLQASEQQLLTIMEKAGSVTEILNVQNQLSSTRSQIERIKGQMNYIEHTSATSLLQIDLEQSKLFATIVVDRTVVQAQDLITFRANVSGGFTPYSYEWDFGDGATSTNVMPVHAYRGAGDYTVKLTVTDDHKSKATDIKDRYINVLTGWSAANTARSAWNGITVFGQAFASLLIWMLYFSPIWIIAGIVVYLVIRRNRKRRVAMTTITNP